MKYIEIHADDKISCTSVPPLVLSAILEAVEEVKEDFDGIAITPSSMRQRVAEALAPKMNAKEGQWRFCSCFRHENTTLHALIYSICSTIAANAEADRLASREVA